MVGHVPFAAKVVHSLFGAKLHCGYFALGTKGFCPGTEYMEIVVILFFCRYMKHKGWGPNSTAVCQAQLSLKHTNSFDDVLVNCIICFFSPLQNLLLTVHLCRFFENSSLDKSPEFHNRSNVNKDERQFQGGGHTQAIF